MWLRQLVGVFVVVSFIGMNTLIVVGLMAPEKTLETLNANPEVASSLPPPTVTIKADPGSVGTQSPSALSWDTTGNATECVAGGDWTGNKTPFGAESTGRLKEVKTYTFKITCSNSGGSAEASVDVAVTQSAPVATKSSPAKSSSGSSGGSSPTFCGGRTPCYGTSDVASHSSSGNCWGWNGDRVINITGFDVAYHQAKTGISSIRVASVCGTNLSGALDGSVSAESQTRNHNQTTKNNGDKNEIPYFVGYYDATK
jgi:hypothetical protein